MEGKCKCFVNVILQRPVFAFLNVHGNSSQVCISNYLNIDLLS